MSGKKLVIKKSDNTMKKNINTFFLLLLFFCGVKDLNAQVAYDSIVIQYSTTNGGEHNCITIYPHGLNDVFEYDTTPSIRVECTENITAALQKRSGTGIVYSETRQKWFLLKDEFLIDSSGESYLEKIMESCWFIKNTDGNIWVNKCKTHDEISEGYAICGICFYGSCLNNKSTTIDYHFVHHSSDVFREEYLIFISLLKELGNIPQYLVKNEKTSD